MHPIPRDSAKSALKFEISLGSVSKAIASLEEQLLGSATGWQCCGTGAEASSVATAD